MLFMFKILVSMVLDDGEDGGNGSSEGVHKVKARFLLFDL